MLPGVTLRLRVRLDRLEKHATNCCGPVPARDLIVEIQQRLAWLRGEGQPPRTLPARPGSTPPSVAWASADMFRATWRAGRVNFPEGVHTPRSLCFQLLSKR
jgi:hypothetical protein